MMMYVDFRPLPIVSIISLHREEDRVLQYTVNVPKILPIKDLQMTVALYANIILLLCVGVATECDTWNSDVENEQPRILIY